jgi:hypothetical protein
MGSCQRKKAVAALGLGWEAFDGGCFGAVMGVLGLVDAFAKVASQFAAAGRTICASYSRLILFLRFSHFHDFSASTATF